MTFRTQAICFAEQYGKFKMPLVDEYVDGNETLADNVCDNSALRHSWLAYQMWAEDHQIEEPLLPGLNFTIPQIFYMTFGQVINICSYVSSSFTSLVSLVITY